MEGLPSQVIYDLYVSQAGRLYLGTEKGLVSFDGVRFSSYDFIDNLGFAVNSIQEDEHGVIWCKNFANQIFKLENDKLLQPEYIRKILQVEGNNLVDFYVNGQNVFMLTEHTFFQLNPNKNPKILLQLKDRKSGDSFTAFTTNVLKDSVEVSSVNKHYFLNNNTVINEVDIKKGQKETILFKNKLYYIVKGKKNEIHELRGNLFNQTLFESSPLFYKLAEASSVLWLCTSSGIYPLDTEQNKILPGFFTGSRINDIVEDKEGNLWVSSLDEGLFFIPNIQLKRMQLPKEVGDSKITSLFKNIEGKLFAGTSNGKIVSWNQQQQLERVYDTNTEMNIEFLYESEMFMVTSQGIFNRLTGELVFSGYYGKGMVKDGLGNHVIASFNSAGLLSNDFKSSPIIPKNFNKKPLVDFNNYPDAMYAFRSKRARCVYFDHTLKTYYVGYSDGLFAHLSNGMTTEIKTINNQPIIASEIQKSSGDGFWVASAQQGLLNILNCEIVAHYQQRQGLTGSYCKRIEVTSIGVWVLTDSGINFLRNGKSELENISFHLGFKGLTFNDFLVDEHHIWIATNEGIITAPLEVLLNQGKPNFSIAGVFVKGIKSTSYNELSHDQNQIELVFQTQFFKGLGDYTYEYRLKEVDTQWKTQSSQLNKVTYLSLKPGKYTFQARVKYGNEYTPIEQLIFQIKKPFWATLWFISFLFLIVALVFYILIRLVIKRVKKKQEMKEKLVLSQLTALRSQMNPHFLYNVLNAVQGLIYDNQKTKASEYLGSFSDLMRKTLDISDQSEITIAKELETIELYVSLEEARFEEKTFFWSLEMPNDEDLTHYVIPSLILQPFIENAIKHGLMHKHGDKLLHLKIDKNEGYWNFEITDNGIGRKQSAIINAQINRHRSFATKALQNRIDLLNQVNSQPIKIEIIDLEQQGIPQGTKVLLQIPIKPLI